MAPSAPQASRLHELLQIPAVLAAIEWLDSHSEWTTQRQIDLTEIPAPPFGEAKRARALGDLFESAGWKARIDDEGNVIAETAGAGRADVVLVSAHLDTALVPDGPVHVHREGSRLLAPGITDNGAGLAALVALATVFRHAELKTKLGVVFAGNVGEEGEGNLRGMRALVAHYGRRLRAAIAVDSASLARISSSGVASRRLEAKISGPGGHSWADAGSPNPIHAIARAISRMAAIPLSVNPPSTLSVTVIEGGTAINAIPGHASIKIDLRSESEGELDRLENEVRRSLDLGVLAERESARRGGGSITLECRSLGARPGGRLASNSELLAAIQEVDRHLGIRAECMAASTDANVPLSLGIPAVCIGAGGTGGRAHTPEEWYDPAGRQVGLARVLLALLLVAGVRS